MPEEETKSPVKKIIIGLAILIFLLLVPFTVYIYTNNSNKTDTKSETGVEAIQKEAVEIDNNSFGKILTSSSNENIGNYLSSADEQISASGTNKLTRDLLLLRKAMILAVNRDSNFTKNQEEATNIFISLINNSINDNATSTYIKNYATIAVVRLHNECCASVDGGHDYLFDREINGYRQTYQEYIARGYSQGLSKLLALNDLSDTVSGYIRNDIAYSTVSMDMVSRILYIHSKDIDKETKQKLTEKLGASVENLPNLKAYTYRDYISTTVLLKSIYAFAYDTYSQQTKTLDAATNKKIDQNYEDLLKLESPNSDQIGLNQVKFYNCTRYAHSLNRRYGKNLDKSKVDNLIKQTLLIINSSKEIQSQSKNYFTSTEVKNGTFLGAYFVSLRTTNKELDTYFKSIGI